MTEMQTYCLIPQAPLVFRSGRPFLAGAREPAQYPWPSAWAGMLRTRYMDSNGLSPQDHATLRRLPARGALLARRGSKGAQLFVPKPADALALADTPAFLRVEPRQPLEATGSDLPAGLWPIGLADPRKGKPKASNRFWPMVDFLAWAKGDTLAVGESTALPIEDIRTHVGLDAQTLAADTGRLFQTSGLDFAAQRPRLGTWPDGNEEWMFVGQGPKGLPSGLVVFGGERRLSVFREENDANLWRIPDNLASSLRGAAGLAITLATPALFDAGWRPAWLGDDLRGTLPGTSLRVCLRAAAVERWQPVSGWDLQARRPKPSRRAVAVGATYWFEILDGALDPHTLWLSPISDAEQDRLDGFGLALLRPWSSTL